MNAKKVNINKKSEKAVAQSATPKPNAEPVPSTPGAPSIPSIPSASHKPPRPGLGRGLGALIGSAANTAPLAGGRTSREPLEGERPREPLSAPPKQSVMEVAVMEVVRSPWQPRQSFDESALDELTDSIRANGVLQPLLCRKNQDGRYELIAGERRLRAAIKAKLKKVPILLLDAEDRRAAEISLIENIQRQDLNIIEEAEGYRTLADSFQLTQKDVADRVGKSRESIANAVRLLELPNEVKQLLAGKQLSAGHAKVLLGLGDETEQVLLGRKCVTDELSVRTLENLIKRRRASAKALDSNKPRSKPDLPESYIRDLVDKLHKHFGTAVRLSSGITHANGKHTKGMLEIDFYDNDDLDRLLGILGITVE
jgi:ParB family chromosome partitioning protein